MNGRKYTGLEKEKEKWAYLFISIPCMFYICVRFIPTLYAFFLSFTDWDIISESKNWLGISNYTQLFADKIFYKTLINTGKYVLFGLPCSLILGFILAYNIDKAGRTENLFKMVYFMPYITSMVAVAWVWRWFYQPAPNGVFNNVLVALGINPQPFLKSTKQAIFCIITPTVWADLGFQMIIFLAGIRAIPEQYYEVAEIDGASTATKLFKITLPLLKSTTIFLLITGTIRYLRIFTQVLNITSEGDGGPLNSTKPLVLYIYQKAFRNYEMGYAASMSVVLFFIIFMVTLLQMRLTKKND